MNEHGMKQMQPRNLFLDSPPLVDQPIPCYVINYMLEKPFRLDPRLIFHRHRLYLVVAVINNASSLWL